MPANKRLALRMDDPGTSSKRYEVYSDWVKRIGPLRLSGDWLFLKYFPPFKKWGPYRELRAGEWEAILELLQSREAKLTVGVTAAWAINEHRQIPFPERFPRQAAVLRAGAEQGLLEIANHGFVHCVLPGNQFKPRWFRGNREYHREFWDWVPRKVQERHIARAQEILQGWLGMDVVTFVPPGNVFTEATLEIANQYGLRYVSCDAKPRIAHGMNILGNEHVIAFHDRELVLEGVHWLESVLDQHTNARWQLIREMAGGETRS